MSAVCREESRFMIAFDRHDFIGTYRDWST